MSENPYEPPNVVSTKNSKVDGSPNPVPLRDAIVFNLALQLPILFIGALILDGGVMFRRFVIVSVAFWVLTLILLIIRTQNVTEYDVQWVKWGYLPILLINSVIWVVVLR